MKSDNDDVTCPECRVPCKVKDMRQNFHVASLIDVYKSTVRPVSSRARIRSNQGDDDVNNYV